MKDLALLLATCITAAVGFALIAFSQKQHWPLLRLGGRARPPTWFRPAGCVLLGLAAVPALIRDGLAFGLLLWIGLLTISAILTVCLTVGLTKRASKPGTSTGHAPREELGVD